MTRDLAILICADHPWLTTNQFLDKLDANLQKAFRISESKQLTIRVDATNVLNHPEPFIPLFTTNNVFISQFGVIECGCGDSKSGNRAFQAKLRLTF